MSRLVVGLDAGSTTTKAVVFELDGTPAGAAEAPTPQTLTSSERHERDPESLWRTCATVLESLVSSLGARAADLAGIAVSGHGDGLCLLDGSRRPVRQMILSTDTRAAGIVRRWRGSGLLDEVVRHGGAVTFAGATAPLLAWVAQHEPELLARARWALTAKDWIQLRLSGTLATDRTDAPGSFIDVHAQDYSATLAGLYGLPQAMGLFPDIREAGTVIGQVTAEASEATGLPAGLPVVAGLHDVVASLLGTAGTTPGHAVMVAGTFGINIVMSDHPVTSGAVNCRPGPTPHRWTVRSTSPGAGANLAWTLDRLEPGTRGPGRGDAERIDQALDREPADHDPVFLPYLYGGPFDRPQRGSFVGVHGWHTATDLVRAVLEGLTLNQRAELERLSRVVPLDEVYLTGGAARNRRWVQLYADVMARPLRIPRLPATGALGAAMCAAVGAGAATSLDDAADRMVSGSVVVEPRTRHAQLIDTRYATFRAVADALAVVDAGWAEPGTTLPPSPAQETA